MTEQLQSEDTLVNIELSSPRTPSSPQANEYQAQSAVEPTKRQRRNTILKKEGVEDDYDMTYGNIGLRLKHYDDVFSAFDGRPYTQRHLSLDFLEEVQSRVKKTLEGDAYEVYLLIPSSIQDSDKDDIVRRRLRLHYSIEYEKFRQEAIQAQLWSTFIVST
jgi:hypothetical protein